jgi:hypothetical protein
MSLTAPERETIITLNDEDDYAEVYTAQRPWITKLRKNPSAELVDEGTFEGSAYATFRVPKSLLTIRSKTVKRELTDEQRQELQEWARHMRSQRVTPTSLDV